MVGNAPGRTPPGPSGLQWPTESGANLRSARSLLAVVVWNLVGCACHGANCTTEGDVYSAHELHGRCCSGLVNRSLMFVPSDTYEGDDLPEGCGADAVPPDMMVCLACGDGFCGEGEHFCNCSEDCAAPDPM